MERWLRETPLPQPERVLARQEPVAEAVPEAIVERALVVVAGIVLQHMLDVRRIGEQKPVIGAGLQMNDIAVSIRGVEKRADRIGTELEQHTEDRITARSSGKCRSILKSRADHLSTIMNAFHAVAASSLLLETSDWAPITAAMRSASRPTPWIISDENA